MVCVPCVFIPIVLLIWRFLIQPLLMKIWQYRNKGKENAEENDAPPQLVKTCENGVCSMRWEKPKAEKTD